MSEFQKVLVVMVFRPDRLLSAMNQFLCFAFKRRTLVTPTNTLHDVYKSETTHLSPILFVTTPGTDPTTELHNLAKQVSSHIFFQISPFFLGCWGR